MFLGENLVVWLLLALGGALAAGNIAALTRPRTEVRDGELARPPLPRTLLMIAIGVITAVWALVSLLTG